MCVHLKPEFVNILSSQTAVCSRWWSRRMLGNLFCKAFEVELLEDASTGITGISKRRVLQC